MTASSPDWAAMEGPSTPPTASRSAERIPGAYLTEHAEQAFPPARRTVLGDLREIVAEMRECGDLVHQLTLRDIRIRYKQAALGFLWALVVPIAVVLAGMAVRVAFSFASGRHMDRLQLAGMAVKAVPWAFFVGCLNLGTASLVSNRSLVTKIYFPREVLPLSTVLAQSFDSAIGAAVIVLLVPFLGVTPSWQLLWVPVLLVLLWTLSLAAALFLSRANLFFRDVKYMVQVFLSFGIFITPVILDAPMYGPRATHVMMLNPIAPILEGLRLSIVAHHNLARPLAAPAGFPFWEPWHLAYSACWALGGLLLSLVLFHRSERRFAEIV